MSPASEMKSKTDHWRRAYSHQELNEKAKQIEDDMFVHVKSEIKKHSSYSRAKCNPSETTLACVLTFELGGAKPSQLIWAVTFLNTFLLLYSKPTKT